MTQARRNLISLSDTPYYHCVNRCVRRAFLCGEDRQTGRSFEHRKQWIVDKIKGLSSLFAIDVCAYAVLSNHYHVVLFVDRQRTLDWDEAEVVKRWGQLFHGSILVDRYHNGLCESEAEREVARSLIAQWRERLSDISWYMRCLNEHVARQANKEDQCKGRFWEGRFKCQALLDEKTLLACMAYVDLNPIRAGLCEMPEDSDFTSIQERIRGHSLARQVDSDADEKALPSSALSVPMMAVESSGEAHSVESPHAALAPFAGSVEASGPGLPFAFADYLELVDWTGRAVRDDKRGSIPDNIPPILIRLGVEAGSWIETVRHFRRYFFDVVGPADRLAQRGQSLGRRWLRGVGPCRRLFGEQASCTRLHESQN